MESSKHTVCIRQDNGQIKYIKSAFERERGFIFKEDRYKYKVVHLFPSEVSAKGFIGCYGSDLFNSDAFKNAWS